MYVLRARLIVLMMTIIVELPSSPDLIRGVYCFQYDMREKGHQDHAVSESQSRRSLQSTSSFPVRDTESDPRWGWFWVWDRD